MQFLEEPEAREIYRMLERPGESARFLSFEDAWRRFVGSAGDEGPLMELVYLVTRTETLRERLKQQVDAIRDVALESQASKAALDLLAAVSPRPLVPESTSRRCGRVLPAKTLGASSSGWRRSIWCGAWTRVFSSTGCTRCAPTSWPRSCATGSPRPSHPREALPRPDRGGGYRGVSAAPRVPARRPDACDGPTSQRMAAREPGQASAESCVACCGGECGSTWTGCPDLVADIMNDRGKAWFVTLDLDVAELNPPYGTAIWRGLDFVSEPRRALLQRFLDRQPPKTLALEPARQWLASLATQPPHTRDSGRLVRNLGAKLLDRPLVQRRTSGRVGFVPSSSPPSWTSCRCNWSPDLLRGRWELDSETMGPWLAEQRERIAARFRKETDTVSIEHRDGTVRAHFLVSWGILGSDDKPKLGEDASRKDRLHAEAIRRVELMRGLFPNQAGYGCQGHGHKVLPMPYDGTTTMSIPPDRLPPVWATRINAFANRLIEWQLRPAEWDDYLSEVSSVRKDTTFVMRDLLRA